MAIPFMSKDGDGGILDIGFTLSIRLSVRLHTDNAGMHHGTQETLLWERVYKPYKFKRIWKSIEISLVEMRTIVSQTTGKWNVSSTVCSREQL